jgi:tRNA-2-methylthio-N6-dimethylallyladenosine synthase
VCSAFLLGKTCQRFFSTKVYRRNDRILGLMKRSHTAEEILQALFRIRVVNPKIQLTSQIIAGFPTETESDFDDTLSF